VVSTRKLVSVASSRAYLCASRPLAALRATYEEKTCCLISEEGFEFSAPMVALAERRATCAMMLQLGEVGAHGLAEQTALSTG
jgi:hypothetical protein